MKKKVPIIRSTLSAILLSAFITPASAEAKPVTAVVLGDSFSSGQGGRWRGNGVYDPNVPFVSGTDGALSPDLAAFPFWERVYEEDSIDNGCHRAFSAPIQQLKQSYFPLPPLMIQGPFPKVVNLACSGARSEDLWPLSQGGNMFQGEIPQITRLDNLAQNHDIELIVLGIGGNDMGFGDMIIDCALAWGAKHWTPENDLRCAPYINNDLPSLLFSTYGKVAKTINLVRQTMLDRGKTDPDDYRIVLMGYPAILAGKFDNRYSEDYRGSNGRCPFIGDDSLFFEHRLMPKLNGMYETLAHEYSVDYINPEYVFDGHKLCESGSDRASPGIEATAEKMEWVRYLDHDLRKENLFHTAIDGLLSENSATLNGYQGRLSESMHPNQFGQMALGNCLRKWWLQRSEFTAPYLCTNPNQDTTEQVKVSRLPFPIAKSVTSDSVIPDGTSTEYGELRIPIIAPELPDGTEEPGGMARIRLKIDHPNRGDIAAYIRDPHGGYWTIKGDNPSDHNPFPSQWTMYLPNTNYVPGEWTLVVRDTQNGNTGTFKGFNIFWY